MTQRKAKPQQPQREKVTPGSRTNKPPSPNPPSRCRYCGFTGMFDDGPFKICDFCGQRYFTA